METHVPGVVVLHDLGEDVELAGEVADRSGVGLEELILQEVGELEMKSWTRSFSQFANQNTHGGIEAVHGAVGVGLLVGGVPVGGHGVLGLGLDDVQSGS